MKEPNYGWPARKFSPDRMAERLYEGSNNPKVCACPMHLRRRANAIAARRGSG